jgi:hypothetical protein
LEQFQGLRLSIGKFEKDTKSLPGSNLPELLRTTRNVEEKLAECAETLKSFQFWVEDKIQEIDLAQLPFKSGDPVGWEERRNHGTRFEYRVFRTGTLLKVKRFAESKWNPLENRRNLVTTYEYTIQLPGKSQRTLKSNGVDLLTLEDLEQSKKEYLEALEVMKQAISTPKLRAKKAK